MTRIDFYLKAAIKLEVARKLIAKAFKSGCCIFVYTRDQGRARELDDYLWISPHLSFLPHVVSGHPLTSKSPVLIGDEPNLIQRSDVLINFEHEVPENFSRFERVLEIVTEEQVDIETARSRFRYYKERGYLIDVHDLSTLR